MAKRLRILAGPNGSGKTSIYNDLRDSFHWGVLLLLLTLIKTMFLKQCIGQGFRITP